MNLSLTTSESGLKRWFGVNLAELLAEKIQTVFPEFNAQEYIHAVAKQVMNLEYSGRIELHAKMLKKYLPKEYPTAILILTHILGDENPHETGMFTHFYWVLPIGKFIEMYGLEDLETSLKAIEEVTKRGTGEYAIRAFIRKYPDELLKTLAHWAQSDSFHVRRLASEGLRPKLPWATKLDLFIEHPTPVFSILESLLQDEVKFVQRSVANNIRDYLKVNQPAAEAFIEKHRQSPNKHTQWILKHATRKKTSKTP